MAPMTRNRAEEGNAPHSLNATYYKQRSDAALIITEATQVCPEGMGYPGTPAFILKCKSMAGGSDGRSARKTGGRIIP